MKQHWSLRVLALGAVLALSVPAAGLGEELGELDLYDPAIYVEGELPAEELPAADDPAAEAAWEEVPVEALVEEPAGTPVEEPAEATAEETGEAPAEASENVPAEEPRPETAAESGDAEAPVGTETTSGEPEEEPEEVSPESGLPAEAEPVPEAAEVVAEPGEAGEAEVFDEPEALAVAAQGLEEDSSEGEQAVAAAEPGAKLGVGEQFTLDGAALLSGEAVAMYRSDHTEIASVDAQSGVVTAVALGTAVITVTGSNGGTTSFGVEVLNAPDALSFAATSLSLGKGEGATLAAQLPENSAASVITYASSKPGVVKVDGAGNLKAKSAGTAVITATAYNGAQAACKVRVYKAPSKVTLSSAKLVLNAGESRALKAKLPSKTASRLAWTSSNEAVVTVDDAGNLKAVGAGTATVKVSTFNGKTASCKVAVVEGSAPTQLTLGGKALSLGLKEKYQLTPAVGDGEGAVFAYASSKKSVASVSSKGVITAKKKGTAKITVATHNGLKATLTVKVVKAPSKVTLSHSALSLSVGQAAKLTAKLPSGTASLITWKSSDESVATVDASGNVTAVKAGSAAIRAMTFNKKKSGLCVVTVTEDAAAQADKTAEQAVPSEASVSAMVSNLRGSSALGAKRAAIANVVELLINAGFEPAFAAGVGANVYSEGTYGLFESSKYISNYKKRPRYFCYLDGGDYYTSKDGDYALTAVYMSKEEIADYTGGAEARERFGEENFYLNNYSGKFVQNVDLTALEALMETLSAGGWEGKFGLGIVQWTGGRTKTLVSFYRKHAGEGSSTITAEQVVAAENEMILHDLTGSYNGVYTAWKSANSDLNSADAARSAGALVCTKYEIPANKESKAITRGNKAAEIFNIMVGTN